MLCCLFCDLRSAGSGTQSHLCDYCMPGALIALKTLIGWWGDSLSNRRLFTKPSVSSVKLWLQLAEQSRGFSELCPQFAPVVEVITQAVRVDVLDGLKGYRPLHDIPWFAALQQCPAMVREVLFEWPEFHKWVSEPSAGERLAMLPLLLSEVAADSEGLLAILAASLRSASVKSVLLALQALTASERLLVAAGAGAALDHTGTDIMSSVTVQVHIAALLEAHPFVASHPAVVKMLSCLPRYIAPLLTVLSRHDADFPFARVRCSFTHHDVH